MKLIYGLVAVSTMFLLNGIGSAEMADRRLPTTVEAVEGEFDHGAGQYVISKDVTISQGTLKITATKGTVAKRANGTFLSTIQGGPVCFRQRTDKGDWAQGIADRAVHDNASGIVELFGNAHLYVGENEHLANYIRYNTQTSFAETRDSKERKSDGKGIKFVLPPAETDSDAPAAADSLSAVATAAKDASKSAPKPAKATVVKTATPPKRNEPAFSRCA